MKPLSSLLLLAACASTADRDDDRSGTAVGNPGDLELTAVDVPTALQLDEATAFVAGVALDDCEGEEVLASATAPLDLLGPSPEPLTLPAGDWCGGTLLWSGDPDGAIQLLGATDGGTLFEVRLDLEAPTWVQSFTVDGSAFEVELSLGAIDPAELEALGSDVVVEPGDALAQDWQEATPDPVLLVDGEDVLDAGADALAQSGDAGCGCRHGGGSPVALAWLLVLVARRREPTVRARPSPSGPGASPRQRASRRP